MKHSNGVSNFEETYAKLEILTVGLWLDDLLYSHLHFLSKFLLNICLFLSNLLRLGWLCAKSIFLISVQLEPDHDHLALANAHLDNCSLSIFLLHLLHEDTCTISILPLHLLHIDDAFLVHPDYLVDLLPLE